MNTDILIVGAGIAGLTAGIELQRNGFKVILCDKGRGVGGRISSRRIENVTFDHGAQFITAKQPRFQKFVEDWKSDGTVKKWFESAKNEEQGHIRWRGEPAMSAIAKNLAQSLKVLTDTKVSSLQKTDSDWTAVLSSGTKISAGAVVLTPPVPQSLDILMTGNVELPEEKLDQLEKIEYERCIAVMAMLKDQTVIPEPGYVELKTGPVSWMADNQQKGISSVPAVTLHASEKYSEENWDRNRDECGQEMIDSVKSVLGSEVVYFSVHGWRYSRPKNPLDCGSMLLNQSPLLVIAGDAFTGARVEDAARSGWSASDKLMSILT